jgi:predicted ATPase
MDEVFVGREREMAELCAGLQAALLGQGQVVLLAGEPGIGKTRLAIELAAEAQERGATVLTGQTYEWEGTPAYWPWVQLLRGYLRESEPRQVRDELGQAAATIAQLVPEVADLLPGLPALQQL